LGCRIDLAIRGGFEEAAATNRLLGGASANLAQNRANHREVRSCASALDNRSRARKITGF
jgi:hypothetical protein